MSRVNKVIKYYLNKDIKRMDSIPSEEMGELRYLNTYQLSFIKKLCGLYPEEKQVIKSPSGDLIKADRLLYCLYECLIIKSHDNNIVLDLMYNVYGEYVCNILLGYTGYDRSHYGYISNMDGSLYYGLKSSTILSKMRRDIKKYTHYNGKSIKLIGSCKFNGVDNGGNKNFFLIEYLEEFYKPPIDNVEHYEVTGTIELAKTLDLNMLTKETPKIKMKDNKNFIGDNGIKTYLMKDKSTGYYKIGKSINPRYREGTLQSEKPTIEMIKVWGYDIESLLHGLYLNNRVRGEWFDLTSIQVRYICTHF